ncbi:MAG: MFS transporter [Chloroflexi bacterium]|nr:MFS transporter [Chloroflexota bacterium]
MSRHFRVQQLQFTAFAALRYRNYRLWFIGQMVSLMGTWMQSVAQGWLVYKISGSSLALGTISLLGALPTLILMLPAGALADRISKKKILLVTQTMMMLCAAVLTVLAVTQRVAIWHIGLLAIILGIAQSFDAPARQSAAIEMVDDRKDLPSAIALNSMMFNMARIVGPAVGGIVLSSLGAVWCFALNSVSFLAVLIALAFMRFPKQIARAQPQSVLKDIKVGLRYVGQNASVRSIILIVGSTTVFGMTYSVLLPAIAADVLRVGEQGLGYLSTAVGIGAFIGALMVAGLSRTRKKGLLLIIGNFCMPIGLLFFAAARTLPVALAALILVGWANVIQNATANTLVQLLIPDEIRGRVMSVYMVVLFGGAPFNSLQAGLLGQSLGSSAAIAIGAVIMLIIGLSVTFGTPTLRQTISGDHTTTACQQPPRQDRR